MTDIGPRIVKCFVRVGDRLVHYRKAGSGLAVVLLHDSPRSSRLHLDTMAALADQFTIYALDTPGYGNSEPLVSPEPAIADLGLALGETLAALGLQKAALYATHTSSKIALDYAATSETPPPVLILDGLAIPAGAPDEAFIARYMRPFEIDEGGAYIAAEWTRIRDGLRWFPWFDPNLEFRLPTPIPAPDYVADFTLDLFSTGPSYPHAYAGAMRYDPRPALRSVSSPVILAAKADDVLYAALDMLPTDHSSTINVQRLSADRGEWLDWLRDTLARFAIDTEQTRPALPLMPDGPVYIDLAHGQMLVHRTGGQKANARPLLILEAPTTLHARRWQDMLSPTRATIVPELPGYGESDVLANGTLEDHVGAVAAMLASLDVDCADVLAIGLAAPIAIALARDHPTKVGMLVLDGPSLGPSTLDQNRERLCPSFPFDLSGAHLHQTWHMLRDGEAHWPWFDQRVEAIRRVLPEFLPEALHRALVDILKQPGHYGDAALAGLVANGLDLNGLDAPVVMFDLAGDPAYRGVTDMAKQRVQTRIVTRPADIATAATLLANILNEVTLVD